MGESWHLTVNKPLYRAEQLSQDQGLKPHLGFLSEVQGWGQPNVMRQYAAETWLSHCPSLWFLSSFH